MEHERQHAAPPGAAMSVEQYLRTSFEDGDQDYVDGELEARHVGELPHSVVQLEVALLLRRLDLGLQVLPEIRIPVSPTRFRVADLGVWASGPIGAHIPEVAPLLVVEILSPEDRIVRLLPKIQDYLGAGVQTVWVIDPLERRALVYTHRSPAGELTDVLRHESPPLELRLEIVLAPVDRLGPPSD